jgi:hypothetical protein
MAQTWEEQDRPGVHRGDRGCVAPQTIEDTDTRTPPPGPEPIRGVLGTHGGQPVTGQCVR